MMYMTGAECPKCGKDAFFPHRQVVNTLNMEFKCSACGHTRIIQGSFDD